MNADRMWTPHGAARQMLGGKHRVRGIGESGFPEYPRDLFRKVVEDEDALEDADALFHLAWEIARCAPLAPEEHRVALLLALDALLASRKGSTRLPIAQPNLGSRLSALGATTADIEAADAVLSRFRTNVATASTELDSETVDGIATILGSPGSRRPLILDGKWLSLQRLHVAEERLTQVLLHRFDPTKPASERAPSFIDLSAIDSAMSAVESLPPYFGDNPLLLSDEQRSAIRFAAGSRLTLVTGGPGTGKTSIVVSLLRLLLRLGVEPKDIALAAPTGKAANRMEESARSYLEVIRNPSPEDRLLIEQGTAPRTLHRLLGHSPSRDTFRHHARHPLPEKVIIVDESSMIDLLLMERLLSAVAPDAMLVLLGDAEQLPSVDAGAVFRDLIDESTWLGASPAVRLTHSYRMRADDPDGKRVLSAARAINRGSPDELLTTPHAPLIARTATAQLEFRGVELFEISEQDDAAQTGFHEFLERWWDNHLKPSGDARIAAVRTFRRERAEFAPDDERVIHALLEHYDAQRVLCLTRVAPLWGARAVNRWFHEKRSSTSERSTAGARGPKAPALAIGEPVMMLRNDYVRGLFNGDQGVVIRVSDDGGTPRPMVAFPRAGGLEAHPLDTLHDDLTLCYAMTIHKSQGSEYGTVALILPSRDVPLLTKEVLYTAVTRARKSVVIVGARSVLTSGIQKPMERFSGVAVRLKETAEATRLSKERF